MPLKKGYSRRSIGANIAREQGRGKPRRQALAIALSTARTAAARAGKPDKGPALSPEERRRRRRERLARMGGRLKGMKS